MSGGVANLAGDLDSNPTTAESATVGGGQGNQTKGLSATVAGGFGNSRRHPRNRGCDRERREGDQPTGRALQSPAGSGFGEILLIALAVGFAAYALWRFVQAFLEKADEDREKGAAKTKRVC